MLYINVCVKSKYFGRYKTFCPLFRLIFIFVFVVIVIRLTHPKSRALVCFTLLEFDHELELQTNKQNIKFEYASPIVSSVGVCRLRGSESNFRQTIRTFGSTGDFFLDPADVTSRILTVVSNFDKVDASTVTPTSKFTTDLGLDSLDAVEVVMAIEDEFAIEIPDAEADKIGSVEDAVNYIASHPQAK